jgi:predicted nuclease of predicted toxin-antitoxin system
VRVLLDENLPHELVGQLPGHEVFTVQGLGWSGVRNGELLRRMRGAFDVLVTMDRNLEKQQALVDQPFGTVIVRARSNRMLHLRPLLGDLLEALIGLQPGEIRRVG